MYLKFSDEDVIYTQIQYIAKEKCFRLMSDEGMYIECEKFLELDDEYNLEDYCFAILNTKTLNRENDIFQVYDKQADVRLGWIFPIQALVSKDHDYIDNIYFLKYAYVATYLLLSSISEENMRNSKDSLKITDFYPEDAIIFVLCISNCNKIKNFCIEDYTVDLFGYGYSFLSGSDEAKEDICVDKRVNVRRISEDVRDKSFIIEVFKSLLVQTSLLPLAKFHMLYQIIELLIGDIFSYEFKKFNCKIGENTNNLFDMKDDLQKITGEKYRVRELFGTYTHLDSVQKEQLMDVCNEILRVSDKKEKLEVGDSLYAVRCLIFHNYGSIPTEFRKLVRDINNILEKVVIELLITFHFPNPNL